MKLINEIIRFYEKHIKLHCPECDGVMDRTLLEPKLLGYVCRECGKEWIAL